MSKERERERERKRGWEIKKGKEREEKKERGWGERQDILVLAHYYCIVVQQLLWSPNDK